MIFNKLNAGCGYDLINEEGWLNTDVEAKGSYLGKENFRLWDLTVAPNILEEDLTEKFDFVLLNHVLLCFDIRQLHQVLINLHRAMTPSARMIVIDMDLLKVVDAYKEKRILDMPIESGSLDNRLCNAISGYGSRKAVFTPDYMGEVLVNAGFRMVIQREISEFDSRPKESLVFEATK